MAVPGRRFAERRKQHHLPGGVGDVVFPADDVGYLHPRVVHDDREVVGVATVGALDDEVTDNVGGKGDGAVDEIVEHHVTLRHAEPDGGLFSAGQPRLDLFLSQMAAGAVVLGHLTAGELLLLLLIQEFLRAEAAVGQTFGQKLLDGGFVEIGPLALAVGTVGSADIGTFVGPEAEPGQVVDDAGVVLGGRPLEVGVFDAQHHGALVVPGVEEVVERGAGAPHVQRAGGAGGEAYADVGHGVSSLSSFSRPGPRPAPRSPRAFR